MSRKNVAELLERYQLGKCTPEEIVMVEEWFDAHGRKKNTLSNMQPDAQKEFLTDLLSDIQRKNRKDQGHHLNFWNRNSLVRMGVAASFLLILGAAVYFYQLNDHSLPEQNKLYSKDILPGTNKAVLTLAYGKRIVLNDAKIGKLEDRSGVRIVKASNGKLVFNFSGSPAPSTSLPEPNSVKNYNKIETPKGGQYEVNLSDGTKIWLNAASSLRFPSQFAKSGRRVVQLEGEGYFEVAKNEKMPFIVVTDRQKIQVLGTHFNVNSYVDEPDTKTTLLEGLVSITAGKETEVPNTAKTILKPGQQSVLNGSEIRVSTIHAEDAIAWKNGMFMFKDADLKTVMKTISRWYDVEVEYEGNLPQKEFTGEIHRNLKLSKLLEVLSFYKVHFRIENKKIIVTK